MSDPVAKPKYLVAGLPDGVARAFLELRLESLVDPSLERLIAETSPFSFTVKLLSLETDSPKTLLVNLYSWRNPRPKPTESGLRLHVFSSST